jgi:hypothetical protein
VKITDIECFVLLVPDYRAQACSSAQDKNFASFSIATRSMRLKPIGLPEGRETE